MKGRFGATRKKSRAKKILLLLAVVALVWVGVAAFKTGGAPRLEVSSDLDRKSVV